MPKLIPLPMTMDERNELARLSDPIVRRVTRERCTGRRR